MQQVLADQGGVKLSELLPEGRMFGGGDIRFASCCTDSRSCRPGDLFVALVGNRQDGHDYAEQAVHNGAAAVLAERLLPLNVPLCVTPDTREALGRVCQHLAGRPGERLRTIGVTGVGGKTTTSMLTAAVLRAGRQRVGVTTSLGYFDGEEAAAAPRTTPAPPELAHWMGRMAANGCGYGVLEAGGLALAQRRLAGVPLDAVVVTNLRRDLTPASQRVKSCRRLFEQLKPGGFLVVNADCRASRSLLSDLGRPAITVGIQSPAELTATLLERHISEQTFLLTAGSETVPVRTRIIGQHHVYNCLAAAAVGLVLGIDLTAVVRGLESVELLPGRLERVECGQSYGVFLDYARTAASLSAALKSLRPVTRGRLICVFGAGGEPDRQQRALLGRAAERNADVAVITTDRPHKEPPLPVVHDILDGCGRPSRMRLIPNRSAAIQWALGQARPGDVVFVAAVDRLCEQLRSDDRQLPDDRALVRHWLYEAGKKSLEKSSARGAWRPNRRGA